MVLSLFKDVLLRTRRAQSLQTLYSYSALLVLNKTSLNIDSTLLTLNWQYVQVAWDASDSLLPLGSRGREVSTLLTGFETGFCLLQNIIFNHCAKGFAKSQNLCQHLRLFFIPINGQYWQYQANVRECQKVTMTIKTMNFFFLLKLQGFQVVRKIICSNNAITNTLAS